MATKTLKVGDKVEWDSSGGHSVGKVVRKVTSPTQIKGHKVAASQDNPEYIVKSDKSGGLAQARQPEEGVSIVAKAPDMTAPAAVAQAARQGLDLREKFNRGGTEVGVARAHQLAARRAVSAADVAAISSYFKRHRVDKDARAHEWGNLDDPSAGFIAWQLWGGDAGETWADALKAELDAAA